MSPVTRRELSPSLAVVPAAPHTLGTAFPDVDPGLQPFSSLVLLQIRRPRKKSEGGIHLPDDVVDAEKWNTQVALVRAVGPLAFMNRTTLQPWPEGAWAAVGDYVRIAKYTPDRWEVPFGPADDERALFTLVKDTDLLGKITGDPLAVKAFV